MPAEKHIVHQPPNRSTWPASTAGLIATWLFCLAPIMGFAQPTFESYTVSTDTSARVPFTDGISTLVADDRAQIIIQPDGIGTAVAFPPFITLFGADVDALHRIPARYSIDTARIINGVLIRPGDVFFATGTTAPTIFFDAEAAGIPGNVNLDAFTIDQETGHFLVSFDRFFQHPTIGFVQPGDVIRVIAGQLSRLVFSGSRLPDGVNLDAVHWVDAEYLLMSFDVNTALPGHGGTFTASDDDIVLYSNVSNSFERVISLNDDSSPSWDGGDIDALWAEQAINAGAFRFTARFSEIQESVGSIAITVQRIDGAETAVQARITSVNGSATSGSDFTAVDELLSWADGDSASQWFSVSIIDDGVEETNPERFSLQLTVESGDAELAGPSTLQINILDNDGENLFSDGFES